MQDGPNNKPKIIGGVVISAIILIGILFVVLRSSSGSSSENTTTIEVQTHTGTTTNNVNGTDTPIATVYKDGTYAAKTQYRVPEGNTEDVSLSVTLVKDVISSFKVETVATNEESVQYQAGFDNKIDGAISGKKLDDADVSRLGGASLTSDAFNDLLTAIRNQAKN